MFKNNRVLLCSKFLTLNFPYISWLSKFWRIPCLNRTSRIWPRAVQSSTEEIKATPHRILVCSLVIDEWYCSKSAAKEWVRPSLGIYTTFDTNQANKCWYVKSINQLNCSQPIMRHVWYTVRPHWLTMQFFFLQ